MHFKNMVFCFSVWLITLDAECSELFTNHLLIFKVTKQNLLNTTIFVECIMTLKSLVL